VSRSLTVGITGGIGCGKTEVGRILQTIGVSVMDADDVARQLMEPGSDVYAAVVREFGKGVLLADGRIDRGRLANVVFADAARLARLNAIVHPPVRQAWRRWVAEQRERGHDAAVIIPLLFEIGETRLWDAVICVSCPPELVLRRLAARGMSESEVRRRMAAQMPLEEKRRRADYVLENDGTLEKLKSETISLWRRIKQERSGSHGQRQVE